jgi:D-alanyl-lipoteichoic acid acyltransferase DltB (MBOAT superfamily)
MLFPTIDFLVFFGVVFPITWFLVPHNTCKKIFLLFVSYVFYSFWDWHFVFLLLFSSSGNYVAGLCIAAARTPATRKAVMIFAVAANLSLLAYFKYYDFLAAELDNLAGAFGIDLDVGSAGVALPVAISFLTFHGLSYVIDVGRGKVGASRSLLDLMLYIAFFPHLVAGPIVRAADFLKQLARPSNPADVDLAGSMMLILGGLFKKVVIASHVSVLFVDPIFTNPTDFGRLDLVLGGYAYAIVIYCDFSAYTDIAIGVANLLGYRFPQNFNQPYRALSLQDFWRRWHMSLSSWLRDYLYIPLGGSRGSELSTYRNLMLTMVLGGLWHGAGLQFIVWGLLHGLGLAVERLARTHAGIALENGGIAARLLGWLVTFNFVCVAWIFFRSPSLADGLGYFRAMIADTGAPPTATPFVLALMAVGLATQFIPLGAYAKLQLAYERAWLAVKVAVPVLVVWVIAVLAPAGIPPFIYFQF